MIPSRSAPPASAPDDAEDPLIATFLQRVGPKLATTFTNEQLAAVRRAFSARAIGRHAIDWRRTLRVLGRTYYVVFLFGRDARAGRGRVEREPGPFAQFLVLLFLALALAGVLVLLAALAYLLKTALGIDVFPGFDMLNDPAIERLGR